MNNNDYVRMLEEVVHSFRICLNERERLAKEKKTSIKNIPIDVDLFDHASCELKELDSTMMEGEEDIFEPHTPSPKRREEN